MPLVLPDPSIRTYVRVLADSVWTLLQNVPGILAFDTPNYTTPTTGQWWIFYPEGGTRYNDRAGGIATALDWGFQLVCVGRSRSQVLNVADKADQLLIGANVQGFDYSSVLTQVANGAQILPDVGDPIGPRLTLTRQYRLTTRS